MGVKSYNIHAVRDVKLQCNAFVNVGVLDFDPVLIASDRIH